MASVFDETLSWAEDNFGQLDGKPHTFEFLEAECRGLLREYPGISLKKWLFVYSPESAGPLFEVADVPERLAVASAKLRTVAQHGGMLLGADF